jgi:methylmalonyl-CoA/ethylmalonyl-CoA epimerase
MLKKIDHIGIAVSSLKESVPVFQKLGLELKGVEEVPSQKVKVAFFQIGDVRIELLEPTSSESTIAKFLEKKGEGLHHLALETDSLEEEMVRLRDSGFQLIDQEPREGAHHTRVFFLHPKSTNSVLTEVCTPEKENK